MTLLGGLVQQVGVAMAIGGFALWIATILYRMLILIGVHSFQSNAFVIGFYARAAGTVGLMAAFTGGIIKGTTPWPWVIAVLILGAPSVALLVVRPVREESFKIDWPKRDKP